MRNKRLPLESPDPKSLEQQQVRKKGRGERKEQPNVCIVEQYAVAHRFIPIRSVKGS
ncbi:conserved hypothetical protein [Ricinus communis]|uniref:Uncharacterized protein n=1 Tax=Ricinus communis TaxID=3988 RepID=B9SBE9_RICCO|nr:conserved hypothetical protein [Ricinus communis]